MKRLIDAAARRLAAAGGEVRVPGPPAEGDALITRRDGLRVAAGTGIAFGTISLPGPLLGRASAEGYCLRACQQAADDRFFSAVGDAYTKFFRGYKLTFVPFVRVGQIAGIGLRLADDVANNIEDWNKCQKANCGDPKTYPPPSPSPAPPPLTPGCPPTTFACPGSPTCCYQGNFCCYCSTGVTCCYSSAIPCPCCP
jgi:hypothetical protein